MKLNNKTVLITGGSKGIGKGIAKAYLNEGAKVIICARNEADLIKTVDEFKDLGQISHIRADLTQIRDIHSLKNLLNTHLDVLVNNASILGIKSKLEDYPSDIWNDVININLNAQFYLTKELIPLLKNADNSSIINVSSSVGREARADWGAYSVSKFGMEALTQILSQELGEFNIRVNSVNPGGTRTEMRASAYPDEDPDTLPTPEDISPVFVYLASDDSIGITGKEFNARDYI